MNIIAKELLVDLIPGETPSLPDDPKQKPEIEPDTLPEENPGILPGTHPGKNDDDDNDDDNPFDDPEVIGDDPDTVKTKMPVM